MNNYNVKAIRNINRNAFFKIGLLLDGKYITASVGNDSSNILAETVVERNINESFEEAKLRALDEALNLAGFDRNSIDRIMIDSNNVGRRKRRNNRVSSVGSGSIVDLTEETNNTEAESSQIELLEVMNKPDNVKLTELSDSESVVTDEASVEVNKINKIDNEVIEENTEVTESDVSIEDVENKETNKITTDESVKAEKGEETLLEEAMRYIIPFGSYKGQTIGDVLQSAKGVDTLKWIAFSYNGHDIALKKAARLVYQNIK